MITLFKDLHIVDGYNRSIIHDFTRNKYYLIPKEWSRIISVFEKKINLNDLHEYIKSTKKSYLKELLEFLQSNEMIFDVDLNRIDDFPSLNLRYETPSNLDAISIDLSENNISNFIKLLSDNKFDYTRTFRIFISNQISLTEIKAVFELLKSRPPGMFTIYINEKYKKYSLEKHLKNHGICILEYSKNTFNDLVNHYTTSFPIYKTKMSQVSEAQNYNSFFNKSIFITKSGEITVAFDSKSGIYCLEDLISERITIKELLKDRNFTILWNVKKDSIEICKDCELRYICIDSRTPQKNNDTWSYETSCSYNPYISLWDNESCFIPTRKMGTFNNQGQFILDKKMISSVLK